MVTALLFVQVLFYQLRASFPQLAVCLFDCIMAEFSQMLIHGQEVEIRKLISITFTVNG